jgi:hypothetical protein
MCSVINDIECKCLEALYRYLKERRCVPEGKAVLCFDGIMIPDTQAIRARVLTGDGFLNEVSEHILKETKYKIKVIEKKFDDAFELPEGYADSINDILVLEGKQDKIAADEFVRRFGDRLITCKGRVFWNSGRGPYC